MKNILVKTLQHNFIKDLSSVTSEISALTEEEIVKGLNGFYMAYGELPNLFDCGDVESILYYVNKEESIKMKVFIASITLDYLDSYGEALRHEIVKVFDTEEKAKSFISIGMDKEEMELLWREEVKNNNCLFDTDKLDEALAYGIMEREVL